MKIQILKKDSSKSFSYLAGINRPINPAQVTKLAESINKMGVIRPIVTATVSFLTGKPTRYIIDGQHLFNALLRNNLDIPYVEVNVKDKKELVETIALLNATSKSWTMLDYVTSWGCIANDYKKLLHYYNVYDFELSELSGILSSKVVNGGSMSRVIKRGEFKIIDEDKNTTILDNLTDILTVIPRMDRMHTRYVCGEYSNFLRSSFGSYNHTAFMTNLRKNKDKFILATQEHEKLSEMFKKLSN